MNCSIKEIAHDINIENMVVTTSVSDKLDLNDINKKVAGSRYNTDKFPGLVYCQSNPKTALLLFKSGKVVCTGAKTIEDAHIAISNGIEILSKFHKYINKKPDLCVQNIVATYDLQAEFNLNSVAMSLGLENVGYEPEQFPGLAYHISEPKVAILIFTSGKIVCTGAKSVEDVVKAVKKLREELFKRGLIDSIS